EQALKLNPEGADSWFGKAVCLSSLGREEEAEEAYRKAVEINPRYADIGGDIQ
ncbi:MAG: tetratricopeptide repeat protein, partial [Deltaproteobacteria bacterium]